MMSARKDEKVRFPVLMILAMIAVVLLPAICQAELPNYSAMNLSVGSGTTLEWAEWQLTDGSFNDDEAYAPGTGNVHITLYDSMAWKIYQDTPVTASQTRTAIFYVWVDDSYIGDTVSVLWSWMNNGIGNSGYRWSSWENSVGGYPHFNECSLQSDRGVLEVRANRTPYATYGAEYLGIEVTNTAPEPGSLVALLCGVVPVAASLRRRRQILCRGKFQL